MGHWTDEDWGVLIRGATGFLRPQDVGRVVELINMHRGRNTPLENDLWLQGYCAAFLSERLNEVKPTTERVMDLDLPRRVTNDLRRSGITALRDLLSKSEEELSWLRGIGATAIVQINQCLAKRGLALRE